MRNYRRTLLTFVAASAAALALSATPAAAQESGSAKTTGEGGTTYERAKERIKLGGEHTIAPMKSGITTTESYRSGYRETWSGNDPVSATLLAEIQKMGSTSSGARALTSNAAEVRPGYTGEWTPQLESAVDAHAKNVLRNAE